MSFRILIAALAAAISLFAQSSATFTNPLLPNGPDPWIVYDHGSFYLMATTATNLTIRKAPTLGGLKTAEPKIVWTPPSENVPYAMDIWAPELHHLNGKWYIYFAADAQCTNFACRNKTHRNWVLENSSPDPTVGNWTMKGELTDRHNRWAIDPDVFENRGALYAVWSGWPGDSDGEQDIFIARLKNPWTIEGDGVRLATPEFDWEKHGDLGDGRHVDVEEGPEALKHGGKIFLIFSASHCSTDFYELGMLTASDSSDLLDPKSWKKSKTPVFTGSESAHAISPGHNGFFESPDGKQDWIVYHANPEKGQGCDGHRSTRAQQFYWKPDGTPDFGRPVAIDTPVDEPSGETHQ